MTTGGGNIPATEHAEFFHIGRAQPGPAGAARLLRGVFVPVGIANSDATVAIVDIAYQATQGAVTGDLACTVGIFNRAVPHIAYQAADVLGTGHRSSTVGIFDVAVIPAHQAADVGLVGSAAGHGTRTVGIFNGA
ncbi:hypothetical protein SAMN04490355_103223 [Pelosinus propionicus DSM 13327]|uniref:Uncharacterized protein n=1 Tax=Pelosinus propionicus DSM 13327 TaxID=1123291 RepID=A0A1I4MCS8_9FIRM|nr:hypothetical protein SAMN04490355_103223 [Pelosinus propionicus DSM 13327]